jgi:hypothetical protein
LIWDGYLPEKATILYANLLYSIHYKKGNAIMFFLASRGNEL